MTKVLQCDRDRRGAIFKLIVDGLDKPFDQPKEIDAAQERIDAELARHREEAQAELLEALERIASLGDDGEHSGDRHAECRAIARKAIARAKGETE